jgi:hypothetical protein
MRKKLTIFFPYLIEAEDSILRTLMTYSTKENVYKKVVRGKEPT